MACPKMTNTPNKDHPEQNLDMVRKDFEAWATGSVRVGKFWAAGQPKKERDRYAWASWQAAAKRSAERIAYVEKIAEDAIELCTQQAIRVMELEARVEALSLDAVRLRVSQSRTGYMCLTDFQHELGEASGGISVYADEDDLKKHRNCWKGCGIMKVEVIAIDAAVGAMKEKP